METVSDPMKPFTIDYESSMFTFGSSSSHACDDGFFLRGNRDRQCGGDGSSPSGTWSGTAPICTCM